MTSFLAALIMLFAPAVPTIEVSDTPVAPGLPAYVQELSPAEYEAWALWQNQIARAKSDRDVFYSAEQPFYTVNRRTVTARSGGSTNSNAVGVTSRQTTRDKTGSQSTTTRNMRGTRSQRGWRTVTSATVPTRYHNPNYVPKPLMVYNPYVKSTSERRPDWDNLFIPFNGEVITVSAALKRLGRPIPPETVFRLLMQPPTVIDIR